MNWLAALLVSMTPAPAATAECLHNCQISQQGYQITETFEGYVPFVYKDVGGQATIGYGHLIRPGEHFDQPLVPAQAEDVLKGDESIAAVAVNRYVTQPMLPGQFDALCDFTFNLGAGTLKKSTLLKRVNAGKDDLVPSEFLKYINVNGKPVDGLIRRRKAEGSLYVG